MLRPLTYSPIPVSVSGTAAAVTEIDAGWFEYPIVALALRQAQGDALGTLERLSDLLGHVESKVSDIDYTNLFETHHLDGLEACEMAKSMRLLIEDETERDALVNEQSQDRTAGLFGCPVDRTAEVAMKREIGIDMRSQGFGYREIAETLGYSTGGSGSAGVYQLINPRTSPRQHGEPTSRERMIAARHAVLDGSMADTGRDVGCDRRYVWHCVNIVKKWEAGK